MRMGKLKNKNLLIINQCLKVNEIIEVEKKNKKGKQYLDDNLILDIEYLNEIKNKRTNKINKANIINNVKLYLKINIEVE